VEPLFPILASAFPFFRRRRPKAAAGELPAQPMLPAPAAQPEIGAAPPRASLPAAPSASMPVILLGGVKMSSANPSPSQVAAEQMLQVLHDFLPQQTPPLPFPSVSLVSLTERSVGLGNRRGNENRGPFGVLALKGIRLEAVVRFQLWANSMVEAETDMGDFITSLLTARDDLRTAGFLRLGLKSTGPGENFPDPNNHPAWRQSADFSVLYEHPYEDSDGSESLISQIPITINSAFGEALLVTDELARWDDQAAAPLVLRGPLSIGQLSALAFIPSPAPSGTVTLRRTFDGAAGPPTSHPDWPAFLAAVTDPSNPERQAEVVFASLSDFLAVFSEAGAAVTLGPDSYQSLALAAVSAIKLPGVADRLEVSYQHPQFDQLAVVYLRATG